MNRFLAILSAVLILFSISVLVLTPKIASALAASQSAVSLLTSYVKPAGLHLRTGPSIEHAVLCTLREAEAVQVVDDSRHWWQVATRCGEGWVSSKYLERRLPDSPPGSQDPNLPALALNLENVLQVIRTQVIDF